MDIELTQQQQTTSSANEEQLPMHDISISDITTQEPERNLVCNNGGSSVSNSSVPQVQQRQQPQGQDVAINIDARFGPSCVPIFSDAEIVNNIIEASKRMDRLQWLYLFEGCIPSFLIMCPLWIAWATMKCSSEEGNNCSTSNYLFGFGIALTSLTVFILLWAIIYGALHYSNGSRYNRLKNSVRCVVKLEGDKWTRYVNYLYGSNRQGFTYLGVIGGMSFCCRKSHYEKLIARGYGYIVFCKQGFMLDEIYHIVRNEPHVVLTVKYIRCLGLRVYLLRLDGTYTVSSYSTEETRRQAGLAAIAQQTVPFDIYLPDTIPESSMILLALHVQYGL